MIQIQLMIREYLFYCTSTAHGFVQFISSNNTDISDSLRVVGV